MWPRYELADHFSQNYGTKTQADLTEPALHSVSAHCARLHVTFGALHHLAARLKPIGVNESPRMLEASSPQMQGHAGAIFRKTGGLGFFSFTFEILGMKFDPFN